MVYIIEANNNGISTFKIGFTVKQDPRTRLGQIQRNNPLPLKLVGAMIGDKGDEEVIHQAFKDFRLHGEWFSDCPGIRLMIEDFPIKQWDELMHKLQFGFTTPEVVYKNLTFLKFETPGSVEWEIGWREFRSKWKKL